MNETNRHDAGAAERPPRETLRLTSSQMARMSRLLDEALALDEAGRREWLDALSPEYQDIAAALREGLLPDSAQTLNALATLPKVGSSDDTGSMASELRPGACVGPYELLRLLGAGGMGRGRARSPGRRKQRTLGAGHPDTVDSLRTLGMAMAYRHHYADADRLFRTALDTLNGADQENRWSVWYAFACAAAAANRIDDALRYLREAVDRGYRDADGLLADDDLKKLRRNPQFLELIGSLPPPQAE